MRRIFTAIFLLASLNALGQYRDSMYVSGGKLIFRDATTAAGKAYIEVDGSVFTGKLSSIKPDDIEEFSVIKISDAQQIYGAKGQNGAYLIKTKAGQKVANSMLPPASVPLDTAKNRKYNHALNYSEPDNSDSSTYVVDGEPLTRREAEKINPENILSIDILKTSKESVSEEQKGKNTMVVITKPFAVSCYQKRISNLSNDYRQYLKSHHNSDGKLLFLINGVQYPTSTDERIKKLYELFLDSATFQSFSLYYVTGAGKIPSSVEINFKQN